MEPSAAASTGIAQSVDRRLVVGTAEPAVGGPGLERGQILVVAYGVERGAQRRGVDPVPVAHPCPVRIGDTRVQQAGQGATL
jgi:hypothetical protein